MPRYGQGVGPRTQDATVSSAGDSVRFPASPWHLSSPSSHPPRSRAVLSDSAACGRNANPAPAAATSSTVDPTRSKRAEHNLNCRSPHVWWSTAGTVNATTRYGYSRPVLLHCGSLPNVGCTMLATQATRHSNPLPQPLLPPPFMPVLVPPVQMLHKSPQPMPAHPSGCRCPPQRRSSVRQSPTGAPGRRTARQGRTTRTVRPVRHRQYDTVRLLLLSGYNNARVQALRCLLSTIASPKVNSLLDTVVSDHLLCDCLSDTSHSPI